MEWTEEAEIKRIRIIIAVLHGIFLTLYLPVFVFALIVFASLSQGAWVDVVLESLFILINASIVTAFVLSVVLASKKSPKSIVLEVLLMIFNSIPLMFMIWNFEWVGSFFLAYGVGFICCSVNIFLCGILFDQKRRAKSELKRAQNN